MQGVTVKSHGCTIDCCWSRLMNWNLISFLTQPTAGYTHTVSTISKLLWRNITESSLPMLCRMPFLLHVSIFHIPILLMQIKILRIKPWNAKNHIITKVRTSKRKLETCKNPLKCKLLCACGQDLTKSAKNDRKRKIQVCKIGVLLIKKASQQQAATLFQNSAIHQLLHITNKLCHLHVSPQLKHILIPSKLYHSQITNINPKILQTSSPIMEAHNL